MRAGLAALLLLTNPLPVAASVLPDEMFTETFKLINAVAIDARTGNAYVTLIGSEAERCGRSPAFFFNIDGETAGTLFSTLLAAKAGHRSVSLELEIFTQPDPICVVRSVVVH